MPRLRFLARLCVGLAVVLLSACASDVEKLSEACTELTSLAESTESCDELARSVDDFFDSHQTLLQQVHEMPEPAAEERERWRAALAPCLSAHVELSAGPCRDHEALRQALSRLPH